MEPITETQKPIETDPPREKYDKWFKRSHLKKNLKNESVKGGASTVGAQGVKFALTIGSTMILARLLSPSDFGLVAMVTAVTGFVQIFTDMGLGHAVVQKEEINQREVSQLFWFNMLISLGLAIIIAGLGPVLVNFYDEPRLLNISFAYAVMAIFGGLAIQHNALLRRQMKLKTIASIKIWNTVLSILTGIAMAMAGMGYWAIVGISVSFAIYNVISKWIRCDWRPDWIRIDRGIKDYVAFGANISGFNMINYFSRNLDNVLIGKYIGSVALGLYSKAYQLLMLPITQLRDPLNGVVIPGLSALTTEPQRFRNYYRKYLFMLSFFSMPMVVFLGVCSYPIIVLVLGPKWVEASTYFQLLAVAGFVQPATSTTGVVLISIGQSRRFLFIGIWRAAVTVVALVVGIQWGMIGLLIGYISANYLSLIPLLYHSFNKTPVHLRDFFRAIQFPALYSVIAGIVGYVVFHYSMPGSLYVPFVLSLLAFAITYFALWKFIPATSPMLQDVTSIGGDLWGSVVRKMNRRKK